MVSNLFRPSQGTMLPLGTDRQGRCALGTLRKVSSPLTSSSQKRGKQDRESQNTASSPQTRPGVSGSE